ncbi:ectomycorrhiza-regulated esterase [Dentipellis sp. KUC8613]|nr:ectomycorrhiza-regulated esterase [Dentipellis sp. KUC8613]
MALRKSSKITLQQPAEPGVSLVGVLEQLEPAQPTRGRKIALILHGTMGHKDYLFQKRLAQRLPLDSFRFDFRGNHESGGIYRHGGFAEDAEDLRVVVKHLTGELGYVVDLVVGHSRGSIVGMHWLCTAEEAKHARGMVNVSGRYRMRRIYDVSQHYVESFATKGYFDWELTIARKPVVGRIYPHDLVKFAAWDSAIVWDRFPQHVDALTIHGLADKVVPPYDAVIYARALGNRSPGTHNLHYIEDADHNFVGRQDEVVDTILAWWDAREHQRLRTGIWETGVRGKL